MTIETKSCMKPGTLSCDHFELLIDDYLDAELNEESLAAVEAHAENCPHCESLLQVAEHLRTQARLLADKPIPSAVSQRLRAVLKEKLNHELPPERTPLFVIKGGGQR